MVSSQGFPPVSPAPAPTVAAPTPLSLSQPGTTLDSSGASSNISTSGIMAWFGESTVISGIPNWGLVAAAAALLMFGKGRK